MGLAFSFTRPSVRDSSRKWSIMAGRSISIGHRATQFSQLRHSQMAVEPSTRASAFSVPVCSRRIRKLGAMSMSGASTQPAVHLPHW